jgi:small subunit ribosomal protein S19
MSRSVWKNIVGNSAVKKKLSEEEGILTVSKNIKITKDFVGNTFKVHTGNRFIFLQVTSKMVDYYFGEFIGTRRPFTFKGQLKLKKKKKTK